VSTQYQSVQSVSQSVSEYSVSVNQSVSTQCQSVSEYSVSINQSVSTQYQSVNQSINRSINQWVFSINKSVSTQHQSVQSINQSISEYSPVSQSDAERTRTQLAPRCSGIASPGISSLETTAAALW